MDKVKTKQKVFGLSGHEYEGVDYCAKDEDEAIGETEENEKEKD